MKTLNDWILLDRHEAAPTPLMPAPERLRAGNPRQTVWNHYSDPSQQFHVGFWLVSPAAGPSTTPSTNIASCWRARR